MTVSSTYKPPIAEIPRDTWEELKQLADAEQRPPRYQAAYLVVEGVRRWKEDCKQRYNPQTI